MNLTEKILFRIVVYMLEGAAWNFSLMELITRYFGFIPGNRKKSIVHLSAASAVYTVLSMTLYLISESTGGQFETVNGLLTVFSVVYWMFNLTDIKKMKALLTGIFAFQIYMVFLIVISGLIGCISSEFIESVPAKTVLDLITPLLVTAAVTAVSEMSSLKRREPMGFPLMIVSFVIFMFIDLFIGLFRLNEFSEDIRPVILLTIEFSEESGFQDFSALALLISNIAVLVVITVAVVMIIKESEAEYFRKKNTISEYYLDLQKEHYESLSESSREIRKIKHDMKNHVYVMRELYRSGKMDELENYMNEISDRLELADTSIHTGNEIADAIISEKNRKAEENGIRFTAEGTLPDLEMSATDICTVFSNALDNALEAVCSLQAEKRWIELEIRCSGNFLYISSKNPTNGKVSIHENRIVSSKNDKVNHGFGIINIKDAAERYGGNVNINITDDVFHLEIMIPLQQ